ETGAKDLGIERIFETVAHKSRVIVFDIHVELTGIADEKVENLAVIGELRARQDDLIRTFLVELAQPGGSFVGSPGLYPERTVQCSLFVLKSQVRFSARMSAAPVTSGITPHRVVRCRPVCRPHPA